MENSQNKITDSSSMHEQGNNSSLQSDPPHAPVTNKSRIILIILLALILLLSVFYIGWKIHKFEINKSADVDMSSKGTDTSQIIKRLMPIKKERGTYWECIEAIDAPSYYQKSEGKVYFENYIIEGVDYNSFEEVGDSSGFAKDNDFVYAFGNPLKNIDPVTFTELGNRLVKDKNGVYLADFIDKPKEEIVEKDYVDFDDKTVMNCMDLFQDSSWEIKEGTGQRVELVNKMNDNIFVLEKIENLDPMTLEIIDYNGDEFLIIGTYIKDKNGVYLFDHSDVNSNIDTGASKLYRLVKIQDADHESFEIVDKFYVKDKNAVFAAFYKPGGFMPEKNDPEFRIINGSDPDSFKIVDDRDPIRLQSHFYYTGITGEDNANFYARELAIPKNRIITEWIDNMNKYPTSCESICSERGLEIAENRCYDTNFNQCTVSKNGVCISGGRNMAITNDYQSSCCCSGSNFSWEHQENKQVNFCISTDGVDPFVRGVTRSTSNIGNSVDAFGTTEEDECEGDEIIDYFCGSDGGVVSQMGMICPNGCQGGACLPFDKAQLSISGKTTKWEDEKLSFEYDPMFFLVIVTADKMIHLKEKRTGMEYAAINILEIENGLTFDMLYNNTKNNTVDYRDVKIVQIGKYKYIKSTGVWASTGKLSAINYETIIDNKQQLYIGNNLAYHSLSEESTAKIESMINSIIIK